MTKEIYWRIFLNTRDENKARKMSRSILDSLEKTKLITLELYWKDNSLYNMEIKQDILNQKTKDAFFEVINNISKLSNSWKIELPNNLEEDGFDFSGFSDSNFKWQYINWASFMIQDKNLSVMDIC